MDLVFATMTPGSVVFLQSADGEAFSDSVLYSHTKAMHLLQAGVSPVTIIDILGHAHRNRQHRPAKSVTHVPGRTVGKSVDQAQLAEDGSVARHFKSA